MIIPAIAAIINNPPTEDPQMMITNFKNSKSAVKTKKLFKYKITFTTMYPAPYKRSSTEATMRNIRADLYVGDPINKKNYKIKL